MITKKTPIKVWPDGRLSFQCTSQYYNITDAGGTAEHALKTGFVPLGDGCDYILTDSDKRSIKRQLKKVSK